MVEDALTCGLPTKLLRYLRAQTLGFPSTSQKDVGTSSNNKSASGITCIKNWEVGKLRAPIDDSRIAGEEASGMHSTGVDLGISCGQVDSSCCADDESTNASENPLIEGQSLIQNSVVNKNRKGKLGDSGGDNSLKRTITYSRGRQKGKVRTNESANDCEVIPTPSESGSHIVLGLGEVRYTSQGSDSSKKLPVSGGSTFDVCVTERGDGDECFQGCNIGSQDITDSVKKAVNAAEAEARAANASAEAIKTAGDAAAELIKSSAMEVFTCSSLL